MTSIAFWNLGGRVQPLSIRSLVCEHDIDILVLAENPESVEELRGKLNHRLERLYFPDVGYSGRLTILTRFEAKPDCIIRDTGGISIRHYKLPLSPSLLVVAVHLPSKLWKKTEDQILACTRIARYIREAELQVGHSRTVVIGDLNMNPFEAGVVGSEGLHAVMDRGIAARGSRRVNGEECLFFYNPMWGIFGDLDGRPPGTYFYNSGTEVNYFWNIFDQVLLRPSLLPFLEPNCISVVTELSSGSLLSRDGRPNRDVVSDHLPIVCRLNELFEVENVE